MIIKLNYDYYFISHIKSYNAIKYSLNELEIYLKCKIENNYSFNSIYMTHICYKKHKDLFHKHYDNKEFIVFPSMSSLYNIRMAADKNLAFSYSRSRIAVSDNLSEKFHVPSTTLIYLDTPITTPEKLSHRTYNNLYLSTSFIDNYVIGKTKEQIIGWYKDWEFVNNDLNTIFCSPYNFYRIKNWPIKLAHTEVNNLFTLSEIE